MNVLFVALVATRWAQFSAASALLGMAVFPFYALPPNTDEEAPPARTARRLIAALAVVVAVSAFGWVAVSIIDIAGDDVFDADVLSRYFLETSFGKAWLLRLVLAVVLMAVALFWRRRLFAPNAVTALVAFLAAALLVSQAWIGHPASLPGAERAGVITAYAVHVIGAAVWLGALPPLYLLVARALRGSEGKGAAEFALRRFSPVGMIAVAAILGGGIVNVLSRASSLRALADSTWGQIAFLKALVMAAMIAAAAHNRFVLTPRLESEGGASLAHLSRNVAFEQAAGVLVLMAAAVLGLFHPPGMSHH